MRAGLSSIQQTLTPEAAGVLNQSIAEAGRRNHGQTTPLHVAATLLSAPSGYLRQACIRSHPNSSHPLQCRALELCFGVALDRLATAAQNMAEPGAEPPVSNALMAALKRAQANQRRGCPEQQQQPLLAVKVELDQLIISVLDDPGVSRVMREAGFSSPAVKATIERHSITKSTSHGNTTPFLMNQSPNVHTTPFSFNQSPNGNTTPFLLNHPVSVPGIFPRHVSGISCFNQVTDFCPQCSENYERELTKLTAVEKSFRPSLPRWLLNAKPNNDQSQRKDDLICSTQKTRELRKKWRDTCLNLHPNFHQNTRCNGSSPPMLFMTTSYGADLPIHPMSKPVGHALQLDTNQITFQQNRVSNSPPGSPVRTDLVLGRKDDHRKFPEADTCKKLIKALMEKTWWQAEAVHAVASAVTRWKLGNGKHRGGCGSRGDLWLLFTGPDSVGKKKMAEALAEQMCRASPIMICLGTRREDQEAKTNARGKTVIDRIVEAVKTNPVSVIMLEDVDKTEVVVYKNIKHAIENGRLIDSHGRDVTLGNTVFILTGDWSTINPEALREGRYIDEKKFASLSSGSWELGLVMREKRIKRIGIWLDGEETTLKAQKEIESGLSLDLSLARADENTDGSQNSSDVTVDHEDELNLVNLGFAVTLVPNDLTNNVDKSIVFKPINFAFALREIKNTIFLKFSTIMDDNMSLEIEDDVLEKILGGLWHDQTSLGQWIDNVLGPGFDQLKPQVRSQAGIVSVVRLVIGPGSGGPGKNECNGDWLPSGILV